MSVLDTSLLVWEDLEVSPDELRLNTLRCGQSFSWHYDNDMWLCVLQNTPVIVKETESTVMYGYDKATTSSSLEKEALKHLLRDYFQLDTVSLASCYQQWSEADPHFHKIMAIKGIRMLRQDPWECLVGFICSSANNITRITRMVKALRIHYGPKIATIDGRDYHGFPSISALAQPNVEKELRTLGFGYRAKYIVNTATKMMTDHPEAPEAWLKGLRKVPYSEAKLALLSMPGVGPKVADCVCLSSLDHAKAIPVDTHVWQIALRDYGFKTKHPRTKTLTAKLYDQIGDHFRGLFGDYSGWAQSVLFAADLGIFTEIQATTVIPQKRKNKKGSEYRVLI